MSYAPKLVAVSDMLLMVICSREFLQAQGYEMGPAVIYQDNMPTIAMAKFAEYLLLEDSPCGNRVFLC